MKIIFKGYKKGWNKIYLVLTLISLILSIPFIMRQSGERITIMGELDLSLLFIYKSRRIKNK